MGIVAHGETERTKEMLTHGRKVKDHRNVCHDGKEKSYSNEAMGVGC